MMIRKLRIQRAWSQEQLAEFAGLSIRTVQRMEQGQGASLETLKSLAAVFEVNVHDLQQEPTMPADAIQSSATTPSTNSAYSPLKQFKHDFSSLSLEERQAFYQVKKLRGFYRHAMIYAVVIAGLFIINALQPVNFWWALFPALGWGVGLLIHGLSTFGGMSLLGPEWEKKQIEKRLGRRL